MADPADESPRWINGATMGHPDHGKSTLLGFFLRAINEIGERDFARLTREAETLGRLDMRYAYMMDRIPVERRHGISVESGYVGFRSRDTNIMLVDNPGHQDYMRNLITGASQADFGVLVVAANDHENALAHPPALSSKGVQGIARLHAEIGRQFGITSLIVVISKMDIVDFSQEIFDEIRVNTEATLTELGYDASHVSFVPTAIDVASGVGHNVVRDRGRLSWACSSFQDVLTNPPQLTPAKDYPLRLEIDKVFRGTPGTELVVTGKVHAGTLAVGDEVVITPSDCRARVVNLKMRDQTQEYGRRDRWPELKQASAPMIVGVSLRLRPDSLASKVTSGQILSGPDQRPEVTQSLAVRFYMTPGVNPAFLREGQISRFQCGRAFAIASVEKVDSALREHDSPNESGQEGGVAQAIVHLHLDRPMSVDDATHVPQRARFVLMQGALVMGGGQILQTRE